MWHHRQDLTADKVCVIFICYHVSHALELGQTFSLSSLSLYYSWCNVECLEIYFPLI